MELVAERKKPTDEKLLKPLVSQKFSLVGRNSVLEAIPQVIHFGGFQLNKTITQKLRILNKSNASTRMHIVVPTDSPYQVQYNRKGTIYPGASEELVVSFTPSAFKYFYDCIKIHSEAGNFIVPMHAYPVVNKVNFPSHVYFGTKPLGHLSRRTITLSCSVPIEFEFRINVKQAHASIGIHPLEGIIPANGSTEILIDFQPIVMANVFSEIELMISQFGFTPMTCVISGSSSPGAVAEEPDKQEEISTAPPEDQQPETKEEPAVSEDKKPRSVKKVKIKAPHHEEEAVELIDGIKIPNKMEGITATNFVLTQQPGKLKPKDLKRAIDENRALRNRQKAEQEALRQKTGSTGGGRLSFDVLLMEESVSNKPTTRQLKELVFLQELQEIDKMEKDLEFQSNREFIGDSLLDPHDIQFIQQVRNFHKMERERNEREQWRTTFESYGSSANTTPPVRATLPSFYTPTHVPDYNSYKNDLWAKRKRVVARFVQVVSKCIIRQRVSKRLRLLKAWLGPASTRQEVRKMVERDWKFAQVSINDAPPKQKSVNDFQHSHDSEQHATDLPSSIIVMHSFPLYLESESRARFPVTATTDTSFEDFNFFPLHVPLEADLMGYHHQPMLPIPQYVPLEGSRKFRVGAQHECGRRPPRALSVPEKEEPPVVVPASEINWPLTIRSTVFCVPPKSLRIYTPITFPLQTDPEYLLQPRYRERRPRQTNISVLANKSGTISLGIIPPYQLHTVWLAQFENSQEPNTPLWELPSIAPALIDTTNGAPIPIDALSDSESDDENANDVKIPLLSDAKQLFEDALDVELESLASFPRYEAMLQLDASYKAYRHELCMQLPKQMQEIAKHVHDPKAPFVLEGHGELLPLHSWTEDISTK